MRVMKIMKNDIVDTDEGIVVSLWVAGCPHRCVGCHNPETWPFDAGKEVDREEVLNIILEALDANGVHRNFSILGGEPLAPRNFYDVEWIVHQVKWLRPNTKIYLWTGYTYEQICKFPDKVTTGHLLEKIDKLIEGPYIQDQRDITLKLRGSRNQRILVHDKHLKPMCFKVYQEEEPTYNSN